MKCALRSSETARQFAGDRIWVSERIRKPAVKGFTVRFPNDGKEPAFGSLGGK
jgi:hypothetical protein